MFGGREKTVTVGDTTQDRERGQHPELSLIPSDMGSLRNTSYRGCLPCDTKQEESGEWL